MQRTQKTKLTNIGFCLASILIFAIIIGASNIPTSGNKTNIIPIEDSIIKISIVFAGDAMAHEPQINAALDKSTGLYDFHPVFKHIQPYVEYFDFALINFETTTAGPPYSGYPQFCVPDTFAYALKLAGFDFFVNANNHSVDKGALGIKRTIEVFDNYKIPHTGTFLNAEDRKQKYPYILNIKGIKCAILNYTYGTNGLIPPEPFIVNMIDTTLMKEDLKIAKDSLVDLIMVAMHWGTEYQREPNNEQKSIARFLLNNGTDIIIGSHPHVIQPFEMISNKKDSIDKNALIIWSLGNFVSNQRKPYTDGGIMVAVDVEKNKNTKKIALKNESFIPFWVYKTSNPTKYEVLPIERFQKDTTYITSETDKASFNKFINDTRLHLKVNKEFFIDSIKN